jgi:hypothetical protein
MAARIDKIVISKLAATDYYLLTLWLHLPPYVARLFAHSLVVSTSVRSKIICSLFGGIYLYMYVILQSHDGCKYGQTDVKCQEGTSDVQNLPSSKLVLAPRR